ncbi:DNA/RNA helicase domain-containing protein [Kitasatospora sp. NPDC087314]|uniref:DNA/RNA helicase domain-containing protein n=1 Tax=Kitasatospora sp. NPDC087314 TaxID=3364068 RepID=UPI003813BDE5
MLYRGPASLLAAQALSGNLASAVEQGSLLLRGHQPSQAERRMWKRGLPRVLSVLLEAGLGQVEVLVDYDLPFTNRSADLVLAGIHPVTGDPSYVVVEVKLWSQVEPDGEIPHLCRVPGLARPLLNPIEQVRGYCSYLASYNAALADCPERISGVAFLPYIAEFAPEEALAVSPSSNVAMFTGGQRPSFIHLLCSLLAPADGAEAADLLLSAKTRPTPQLVSVAAAEVREREQFVLLDEQRVACEVVLHAVRQAQQTDRKEVVVITGDPGTGKSVIALSLLGDMYRHGVAALHATGSSSFTTTMRRTAAARKRQVQELFKYFNSFMTAEHNGLDLLICDEAHRIRETSANRYTRAAQRTGKSQIEELIDAARVPVFLLDENQIVRPGEMGTVDLIRAAAAAKGLDCQVIELGSQFRGGGSDAYLYWVVRLLGLEPGGPVEWEPDGKVTLEVVDSPQELEAFLDARRGEGYGARMSAGYCWKWTTKVAPGNQLPLDVRIGDWARPWNVYGDRSVAGAPPAALWATDPAGFGQVGCVYTAQGFEYDWSGVILGPDLVWRTDRWVTDRTASKDPVFRKSTTDADIDRLIRNTYKVLLTRGMIGTVVYSTDPETRTKLRELVTGQQAGRIAVEHGRRG